MPDTSNNATQQQLFEQIKLGSIDRVRELLTSNPDLANATSSDGRTALHHAVRESSPDMVRLVMELCPAQSGIACADGSTPLHDAAREPAQRGGLDKINLLLAGNPQAASKQDRYGETPLHIAARAATPDSFNAMAAIAPDAASIRNISGRTAQDLITAASRQTVLTPEQLAVARVTPTGSSQPQITPPAVAYTPEVPVQPRQPGAPAEPPADISTVGNPISDALRPGSNGGGIGKWLSENKFGLIAAGIAAALGFGTGMGTIGTMLIGTLAASAANIFLDGPKSTLGNIAQPLLARAGINIGRGNGNDPAIPAPDTQLPQGQRLDNLMVALLESRNGIMIGERHDHPAFRDSVREMLPRLKASGLQTLSIEIPQEMADQMIRAGSTDDYIRNNPDISRITGGEGTGRSICDLVRSAHACGIKVLGHEIPREQLVEAVMARAKSIGDRLEQLSQNDPEVRRLVSSMTTGSPLAREANALRLGEHLHRTGQRELLYDMHSLSRFSISEEGFKLRNEHAARYIEQNRTGKTIVIGGAYHTGRVLTDQRQQFYDALDRGYPPVLDSIGNNAPVPTKPHLGLDVMLGYPSIDIRGTSGGRIQFEQPQPHMIGQAERSNGVDSDYEVHLPRDLRELPQSPFTGGSTPPVIAPQGLPPAPSSPAGVRPGGIS